MEQAGVEEQVGLDVDQHGHTLARVMAAHSHSVDAAECSTLLGLHGSSSSSSGDGGRGGAASFNILVAADKCGPRGSTALAMVSAAGHRDEVEALLDVKCDPNLECCAFDDKYMTEEKLVSSPSLTFCCILRMRACYPRLHQHLQERCYYCCVTVPSKAAQRCFCNAARENRIIVES